MLLVSRYNMEYWETSEYYNLMKDIPMKRIAIYDMDGTIVCSLHRYRTIFDDRGERIDLGYWRENEHRAMEDSLLPLAKQYKQDVSDPFCITIIATARILRNADIEFISTRLGNPDHIVSRAEGDVTSGGTLKVSGLKPILEDYKARFDIWDIVFYEDNVQYLKTVCDYFNIRGVYIPSKQGH